MAKKYRLTGAFHPKAFESGVFSVSFKEEGKPFLDRHTRHFQIKAKSKAEAIRIARKKLRR